jgi:hypothetical protein
MAKKSNPIPKKVAGVKIPKALRKSKMLRSLLNSPMGREIVANALTAGAGAAAAVLVRERGEVADATREGARKGAKSVSVINEAVHDAANAVMHVVTDAARAALSEGPRKKKNAGAAAAEDRRYN